MILSPQIHNNGSDGEELLDNVSLTIDSLRQSVTQLQRTAPHARDYYVIEDNAYVRACNEHVERLNKVAQALKELEYIQESISDQIESRARK